MWITMNVCIKIARVDDSGLFLAFGIDEYAHENDKDQSKAT